MEEMKKSVRLVAPSSGPAVSDRQKMLSDAAQILKDKGFDVRYCDMLFANPPILFFANTHKARTADFIDAISDDSQVIWCVRGGYGAFFVACECINTQLNKNKILVGFSDITHLHILFNQFYAQPSLHASTLFHAIEHDNIDAINQIIHGKDVDLELEQMNNKTADVSGQIVGGNLKTIATTIGTPIQPDFRNKILILEDVKECGYQILRDLYHMVYSGMLQDVRGIIFGEFILGDNHTTDAVKAFAAEANMPCFYLRDFGHNNKSQPVILGTHCEIKQNMLHIKNPWRNG